MIFIRLPNRQNHDLGAAPAGGCSLPALFFDGTRAPRKRDFFSVVEKQRAVPGNKKFPGSEHFPGSYKRLKIAKNGRKNSGTYQVFKLVKQKFASRIFVLQAASMSCFNNWGKGVFFFLGSAGCFQMQVFPKCRSRSTSILGAPAGFRILIHDP